MARDRHLTGFPEFEQFCTGCFQPGTQVVQVRCVYQFRHARTPACIPAPGSCANGETRGGWNPGGRRVFRRRRRRYDDPWLPRTAVRSVGPPSSQSPSSRPAKAMASSHRRHRPSQGRRPRLKALLNWRASSAKPTRLGPPARERMIRPGEDTCSRCSTSKGRPDQVGELSRAHSIRATGARSESPPRARRIPALRKPRSQRADGRSPIGSLGTIWADT